MPSCSKPLRMSSRSTSRKSDASGERVQKVLANAGVGSRREIDRLIQAGRVVVDGSPAKPGDRLRGGERIRIDGRDIRVGDDTDRGRPAVLVYHKPAGEITARHDPERRPTVFDALPAAPQGRWIVIGRLDLNTSGLLLFTNDGELAHRLMHPSYEIERVYAVRIRGELSDEAISSLSEGVLLDDGPARFEGIELMRANRSNAWYEVRLKEGRKREVRRMFEAAGATVSRLIRISYGPISLGRMKRGACRFLDDAEREALYAAVGLSPSEKR